MTATTLDPSRAADLPPKGAHMNRIGNVVRLHFVNKSTLVVVPWIVMGAVFVFSLAIWLIVSIASDGVANEEGNLYSGASSWMFIYMLVVAVQAVNLTFPYALGMSVTRREYALGTGATFVLVSAGYSAVLTILSFAEEWTGGWGLGGHFFAIPYVTTGEWWERWFVFFAIFVFFFFVGWVAAATFVRWKAFGLLALGLGVAVVLIGVVALLTLTGSWPAVGAWLAASGAAGVAAWALLPTAAAAAGGYLLLRGATPRA